MTSPARARILWLLQEPSIGGAERASFQLANALSGRYEQTVLFCREGSRPDLYRGGGGTDVIMLGRPRLLAALPSTIAYVAKQAASGPTVVVSTVTMVSVVLALLKPLMSYRLIVREPTNPSRHVAYASNRWERIVYAIARRVYRFADVIITNSEDNRQSLPAYYGIPIERITTLRNPVSGSTRCNPVRKRDAHAVRLVTAGRVVRSKRIEDIVMAISVLGPGCELAVIGPTPDPRYLQELNVLIAALGLSCRVQFAGETGDLVCALGNHDVFVLASAYEGFPNVLLDAVQAGLPVVASDCDFGPREIVSPTIGLLFEPGNVGALVRAIREVRKEPLSISQRQEALAEYQPQLLATRFERILKRVGQRLD